MGGLSSTWRRHLLAVTGLVGLVAAVYGGAIGHGFVFDDWQLVAGNDAVRWPLHRLSDLIRHAPGGISYRPLRIASYMIDYRIAGELDPAVFHASNLLYHALTALVLYALCLRCVGSWIGAMTGAAFFAVHPLGAECVAYVSGRRDLLMGLFALLALLAWWIVLERTYPLSGEGRRSGAPRSRFLLLALAIGSAMLALSAKESAVVILPLAVVLAVVRRRQVASVGSTAVDTASGRVVGAALFLAPVALWVVVDAFYLERVAEAWRRIAAGPLAPQPALTLHVLGTYLGLALWPGVLSADYLPAAFPLPVAGLDGRSALEGLALLSVLLVGSYLAWHGQIAGAGLLWFVIALLPVAQIVPYREVVAEHNAYLPMAGLALSIGQGTSMAARRAFRVTLLAAALLVIVLAVRAHARSGEWRDDETLWRSTLRVAPESIRARHGLGHAFNRTGRLLEARRALEEALQRAPRDPSVLVLLSTVMGELAEHGRARDLALRAVRERPDAEGYAALGHAQLQLGDLGGARQSFRAALEVDPHSAVALAGLRVVEPAASPPAETAP